MSIFALAYVYKLNNDDSLTNIRISIELNPAGIDQLSSGLGRWHEYEVRLVAAARSQVVEFSVRSAVVEQFCHAVDRSTHWAVSVEEIVA